MSKPSIDTARDADLRHSQAAMLRAAQRARQLAAQTGTAVVVSHGGVLEHLQPSPEAARVGESSPKRGRGDLP